MATRNSILTTKAKFQSLDPWEKSSFDGGWLKNFISLTLDLFWLTITKSARSLADRSNLSHLMVKATLKETLRKFQRYRALITNQIAADCCVSERKIALEFAVKTRLWSSLPSPTLRIHSHPRPLLDRADSGSNLYSDQLTQTYGPCYSLYTSETTGIQSYLWSKSHL